MTAKIRNRDMWKRIPWQRRAEIEKQIKRMPDGMRKEILRLAFIENLSTVDIAEAAKSNEKLITRNHRPVSKRRVLQIIAEEIPDYNAYQDHKMQDSTRKDHSSFAWHHKKERCANCGSIDRLEWHHMIPAALGGTAEPENMVCLCKDCHEAVTAYQRKIMPEIMSKRRKTKI